MQQLGAIRSQLKIEERDTLNAQPLDLHLSVYQPPAPSKSHTHTYISTLPLFHVPESSCDRKKSNLSGGRGKWQEEWEKS